MMIINQYLLWSTALRCFYDRPISLSSHLTFTMINCTAMVLNWPTLLFVLSLIFLHCTVVFLWFHLCIDLQCRCTLLFFILFYQFSFPRHRQHSNVCTIQHRAPHSREGSRLRQWSLIPECQALWWGWVECQTLDGFRLIHARECCLWMKMIKLDCAGNEKKWKLSKTL